MKLLATDYDGTLKYTNMVTQEDLIAIKKWKEQGNLFVINTGRSMESILAEVRKYNIPVDYFVTNNGGMVFDKELHELFSSYLDNTVAIDIMYATHLIGGVVSYVVNDGIYRHRIIIDEKLEEKRYPGLAPNMSEEELMRMNKYAQIVISMSDISSALELADLINDHFSEKVVAYANKFVVDVVPKGISKAAGVQFLMDRENVVVEDTYTIGDAYNDIPLMKFGVNGSCMNSATDELKKYAKYHYDCVGELIEKNL